MAEDQGATPSRQCGEGLLNDGEENHGNREQPLTGIPRFWFWHKVKGGKPEEWVGVLSSKHESRSCFWSLHLLY